MATLFVIATPIGNMEDISLRALRIFAEVTALACEDTRVTRKIFDRYNLPLPKTMFSYHEHNEQQAGGRIMQLLQSGMDVGLCSDGGCPAISDPGYRIINEVLQLGMTVEVIPGPCAVETAIMSSGMPSSSYTFLGFLPPKTGKCRNALEREKLAEHTMVIYESPHRVGRLLEDLYAVLGDRQAAVCIELTKKFQNIHRGWLSDLVKEFTNRSIKGEVVVVVAGNNPKFIRECPASSHRGTDFPEPSAASSESLAD